jgi:hypothetical protein
MNEIHYDNASTDIGEGLKSPVLLEPTLRDGALFLITEMVEHHTYLQEVYQA